MNEMALLWKEKKVIIDKFHYQLVWRGDCGDPNKRQTSPMGIKSNV